MLTFKNNHPSSLHRILPRVPHPADCHKYVCRAGNDEEDDLADSADSASDTCGATVVSKDEISTDWKGMKIGTWTEKHMCFLNCKRSFWFKYNENCPSKMMVHIAHNSFSPSHSHCVNLLTRLLCQLSLTHSEWLALTDSFILAVPTLTGSHCVR